MSNIFGVVTLKNSNFYTTHALESFFKSTKLENEDEFFLIDNDGCEVKKFSEYEKVKIIKNKRPLNFAENVNQIIEIAKKNKKNLIKLLVR